MLFVDDASPDGTGLLLDDLRRRDSRIHVLHRNGHRGLGCAYVAGFRWALERPYQHILSMDADLSHDPLEIPRLLDRLGSADAVFGSRYIDGARVVNWPLGRRVLSRGAGVYVRLVTGMPFADPTGGYNGFRRTVFSPTLLDHIRSNGYAFFIELKHAIWRGGFRVVERPISFTERRRGASKLNWAVVGEALRLPWALRFGAARGRPREPDRGD